MKKIIIILVLFINSIFTQKILIPMDQTQNDHLKAYGIAYYALNRNINVEWLLNFQGGSFLLDDHSFIQAECKIRGVTFLELGSNLLDIYSKIEQNNMDIVVLEKAPKIAIYSPPNKQPWDDAVTLALTYAEVEYQILWDEEVLDNTLEKYDWLHLHHEDFTGQYGKFYRNYHNAPWYIEQKTSFENLAKKYGLESVHEEKKAISRIIKNYISNGGFLFAMCSATDSFDIALSYYSIDFAHSIYDGTPIEEQNLNKINYNNGIAFENYELYLDPTIYEYSNIDFPSSHQPNTRSAESDYFTLSNFSAK